MNRKVLFLAAVVFPFLAAGFSPKETFSPARPSTGDSIYMVLAAGSDRLPDKLVFDKAIEGWKSLQQKGTVRSSVISIIDFNKPSSEKRLWVIDIASGKVLHHTFVAHGRKSGDLYANKFSNIPDSNQSSLGLYVTGKTYTGKHGLSLKLHGLEPGVNDLAESRAIVMHSAEYVSEQYIRSVGRLGRSFGCPAIPVEDHKKIINTVADGTCLYIHHSSI
jgi:hypothetical protein